MKETRQALKVQMLAAMNNVTTVFKITSFQFSMEKVSAFTNTLSEHRCDVFDYLILDDCLKNDEMLNIITDDSDFSSIDNLTLYTANDSILNP